MEGMNMPEFLQNHEEVPKFTKPGDEERHREKLIEIANATDEDDAKLICDIFAEKYPHLMFSALEDRLHHLVDVSNKAKRVFNSLGGLD